MRADPILLLDMLLAAREAWEFVRDIDFATFEQDRMRQLAVIKLLETVGEAAGHVSPACQADYPELPWPMMIGMRHRLVHGYAEINMFRVWLTANHDLPALILALEKRTNGS